MTAQRLARRFLGHKQNITGTALKLKKSKGDTFTTWKK